MTNSWEPQLSRQLLDWGYIWLAGSWRLKRLVGFWDLAYTSLVTSQYLAHCILCCSSYNAVHVIAPFCACACVPFTQVMIWQPRTLEESESIFADGTSFLQMYLKLARVSIRTGHVIFHVIMIYHNSFVCCACMRNLQVVCIASSLHPLNHEQATAGRAGKDCKNFLSDPRYMLLGLRVWGYHSIICVAFGALVFVS